MGKNASVIWSGGDKEDIRKYAISLGADQVQFLALTNYVSPASPDPRRYFPGVQSFVVMAFRELRGSYMCQNIMRMEAGSAIDTLWAVVEMRLGKFLEDNYDIDVMSMPQHRPFEVTAETLTRIIGPVSIRHIAVQSGMGIFGRNTLVVHPKWGSMVRYAVLLTSAKVESDTPLKDFNPCKDCKYPCVENCPVNAIGEDGIVKQNRCTRYSQPYDVGNFMRFIQKATEMSREEMREFAKTPHFFNLYMASMRYMYYRCIECTRGCPGSEVRSEYASDIQIPINSTTLKNPIKLDYSVYDMGHWDPTKFSEH
jgi:hypothetical protein